MHPASYYKKLGDGSVQCLLCPHLCTLGEDKYGKCRTRVNRGGELITESYGILSAISTDPVEKKPLYHFFPGRSILSIGSFGCNLSCDFCQNCEISQVDPHVFSHHPVRDPEEIVHKAFSHKDSIGLAYTYNEPTIYYEYMIRCAALLKEQQLRNVMVTNGYINGDPLDELLPYMDAFNVDLKSFRDEFYLKRSGATLRPVLETIKKIANSDRHLELTFLIIPGFNDSEAEWNDMISWINGNCGQNIVLHVSRYFPHYKLNKPPTPLNTIQRFLDLAKDRIPFVYPGNIPQLDSHTFCPCCKALIIERNLYNVLTTGMGPDGHCKQCNFKIYGIFNVPLS